MEEEDGTAEDVIHRVPQLFGVGDSVRARSDPRPGSREHLRQVEPEVPGADRQQSSSEDELQWSLEAEHGPRQLPAAKLADQAEHEERKPEADAEGREEGELPYGVADRQRDGGRYVIVGTANGAPTHPAWYANLRADPNVRVEAGGDAFKARATVIEDDERTRLWNQIVAEWPEVAEHSKKTDRIIPVILLEQVDQK